MTVNPRSITDVEAVYLKHWSRQVRGRLFDQLSQRYNGAKACSIIGYLDLRKGGWPSSIVSHDAKASYRRALAELDAEGLSPRWATGSQEELRAS